MKRQGIYFCGMKMNEKLCGRMQWIVYLDGEEITYGYDNGGQLVKNVYLGETRIVTKLHGAEETTNHEETYKQYFYHSDHLGSASLITDYKGDEYQRIEYTPYGETWVEKTENVGLEYLPYKFTGKEMDEETGLYYYGARYLDPKYSRWISVDPALAEYVPGAGKANARDAGGLPGMGGIYNSVNGNLYHYAGNNPVKYIDPDGRIAEVSYSEHTNTVKIIIPVKYAVGTTDEQKIMFATAAQNSWTGIFGKFHVELIVEERNLGEVNEITFNTTDEGKISNVSNHKNMTIYTRKKSNKNIRWTISHEVGHLMNLSDEYIANYDSEENRTTSPKEGWENNIMAQSKGVIEEKNIQNILDNNIVRLEDETR